LPWIDKTAETSFLVSIRDNPDPRDVTLRLIYADWLEEHGRADMAEFIRLCCEIDRMSPSNQLWASLLAQARDTSGGQRNEWMERLGEYGVTDVILSRAGLLPGPTGLPMSVFIGAADFVSNIDHIPVRQVTIQNCRNVREVEAVATCPHLANLTYLSLWGNNIGNAGARALARSPHIARLTHLNLWSNSIGNAGARSLAASRHFANLTHLDLAQNNIGNTGARALVADSSRLTRLTDLLLNGNHISETVFQEIERRIQARREGHARG